MLGENVESDKERFGLQWHGKAECMRIIQQPSIATLKPARDKSSDFDKTENLFIEGDNLEVLKLLQKSYFGKVKMIYIDPPYNTGKEFIYPDKYAETLDTYLKYTGQIDADGRKFSTNTDTVGRYHSNWLNMMYPRLYLARNLLRDDGVIFISIDDNEQSNLKALCDEIFGEDDFIGCIEWNSTKSTTNTALISVGHTHNLVYAKNKEYFITNREHFRFSEDGSGFSNPDNNPRGPWKADPFQVGGWRPNQQYVITNPVTKEKYKPNEGCSWKNDKVNFLRIKKDNRIVFGVSGEAGPQRKRFLTEAKERGKVSKTWWDEAETTNKGTVTINNLFGKKNMFSNPKPVKLILKFIELGDHTKTGIVLDFFAGSATTAHAVMQLNAEDGGSRKYICVQLPEPTADDSEARKAGYKNIADIGKERIRRAAKKIAKEQKPPENNAKPDLGFRVFKLAPSNFKVWEGEIEKIKNLQQQLSAHVNHIEKSATAESILYELLLKSGYPLTTTVKKIKLAKKDVFSIDDGALLICLDKSLNQEVMDAMADKKPSRIICLDEGFKKNDQLKTNAAHTFKVRAQQEKKKSSL
ncbi:MAG: site-specific DNA-methyltransferase [Candidatus Zeuxoniibacter abyssi]|nr:MAG: site-specific DNA-methyltransferase [Candidatus Persebacteraceae bacterium AB1(2)]